MRNKDVKLGEVYFNLFQLITIFNFKAFSKKANQFSSNSTTNQRDTIVEIVRLLDKHLEICFPQMSRENFYETFTNILYFQPEFKNESIQIIEQDPLVSGAHLKSSRFNSQILFSRFPQKQNSSKEHEETKMMSMPSN